MNENNITSPLGPSSKFQLLDIENPSANIIVNKLYNVFGNKCQRILLIQPLPFNTEYFEINQANNKRYYNWPPYGLGVLCKDMKLKY
jgi:hypothetical protein